MNNLSSGYEMLLPRNSGLPDGINSTYNTVSDVLKKNFSRDKFNLKKASRLHSSELTGFSKELLIDFKKNNSIKSKGFSDVHFISVSGNTIEVQLKGLGVLIDPSRRYGNWKKSNYDLIIVTHAHTDHFDGLDFAIEQNPNATIIMSQLTLEIIENSFLEKNKKEIISSLHDQMLILKNEDNKIFNDYQFNFMKAGHCPGALAFEIIYKDAQGSLAFAGEFSIRPIGGEYGDFNFMKNPDILFCDGKYLESKDSPTGSFLNNNKEILSLLEKASEEQKSIVFGASSLSELQEVYSACAAFQRAGVASEYDLYLGSVNDVVKKHINESTLFPWDIPVNYSSKIHKKAIHIFTSWVGEKKQYGAFHDFYKKRKEYEDVIWSTSQKMEGSDFDSIQHYNLYTHASYIEVLMLALYVNPRTLCIYAGGGSIGNIEEKLALFNIETRDAISCPVKFEEENEQ